MLKVRGLLEFSFCCLFLDGWRCGREPRGLACQAPVVEEPSITDETAKDRELPFGHSFLWELTGVSGTPVEGAVLRGWLHCHQAPSGHSWKAAPLRGPAGRGQTLFGACYCLFCPTLFLFKRFPILMEYESQCYLFSKSSAQKRTSWPRLGGVCS